jgi:hypothetical protein
VAGEIVASMLMTGHVDRRKHFYSRCSSPGKILDALNTITVKIFSYRFVSEGAITIFSVGPPSV